MSMRAVKKKRKRGRGQKKEKRNWEKQKKEMNQYKISARCPVVVLKKRGAQKNKKENPAEKRFPSKRNDITGRQVKGVRERKKANSNTADYTAPSSRETTGKKERRAWARKVAVLKEGSSKRDI